MKYATLLSEPVTYEKYEYDVIDSYEVKIRDYKNLRR